MPYLLYLPASREASLSPEFGICGGSRSGCQRRDIAVTVQHTLPPGLGSELSICSPEPPSCSSFADGKRVDFVACFLPGTGGAPAVAEGGPHSADLPALAPRSSRLHPL